MLATVALILTTEAKEDKQDVGTVIGIDLGKSN